MRSWGQKKDDWHVAVIQSLSLSAPEADQFLELEWAKSIALDCVREVLGITGGKLSCVIQHHSKEAKRCKASLSLLRVVRREIHACKLLGGLGSWWHKPWMVASAGETDRDLAWTQLAQKSGVYNII